MESAKGGATCTELDDAVEVATEVSPRGALELADGFREICHQHKRLSTR